MANVWKLYTNGDSSFDGSSAGLMLISHEGKEYTYALRFRFKTTNNEAEYEALLAGLRIAQEMEIRSLAIFGDSQLMHIQRNQNKTADVLSKLASMTFDHLMKEVLVEVLAKMSINDKDVSRIEEEKEVPRRLATLSKKYIKGLADLTWNLALWWSKS
ncbi:reverse transcriptase domain-containing protein [Tanacetum coccineum]